MLFEGTDFRLNKVIIYKEAQKYCMDTYIYILTVRK